MSTGRRERGDATRAVAGEIKAERTRKKMTDSTLTQQGLSTATGIPFNTIKSIETGRAPIDVDQLFLIADALNIRPSTLVERAEGTGDATVTPMKPKPKQPGPRRRIATPVKKAARKQPEGGK